MSQEFAIKTAAHARHLLAQAKKRIAKAEAAITADEALVVQYKSLAESLPEGNGGAVPAEFRDIPVGSTVQFKSGRGPTIRTFVGVVTAVQKEDDKVKRYRVQVGEDFDAALVSVFPGSIVGAEIKEAPAEVVADESADE